MTAEEAKANQDRIAEHYNLSHWYGTDCRKCCGVYPKLHTTEQGTEHCWYECEVCGRKTSRLPMPWVARDEWNESFDELVVPVMQMSIFDFMGGNIN